MRHFENALDAKHAFYHMASKAKYVNRRARIWFERPAYGKYEGRRDEDDSNGQRRIYYSDESLE